MEPQRLFLVNTGETDASGHAERTLRSRTIDEWTLRWLRAPHAASTAAFWSPGAI